MRTLRGAQEWFESRFMEYLEIVPVALVDKKAYLICWSAGNSRLMLLNF